MPRYWERIGVSESSQNTIVRCYLSMMDLECSDLFEQDMQSGHGKVYTDSFALFISLPFASLCALILNYWCFSDFHLHTPKLKFNMLAISCLRVKNIRVVKIQITKLQIVMVMTYPIRGLSKSIANLLLSGLIVFAWPPYKYLLCPIRKWGKFPPCVVTKTSLWTQTL